MKKKVTIMVLMLISIVSFYYAMFWGWASGAGAVDPSRLKIVSNYALSVSFVLFWIALGMIFYKRKIVEHAPPAGRGEAPRP